jgi:hypothetical protein
LPAEDAWLDLLEFPAGGRTHPRPIPVTTARSVNNIFGFLVPATAAATPAITDSGAATEIAAVAPDGSLWFYWAADGTSTWHAEQVAGPGIVSVHGAPAITDSGGATEIAAATPDGGLDFWWAADGTSTWHYELVAGPTAATSAPAMTVTGDGVEIAAAGPDASLWFYWAYNGTSTWHTEQVDGAGSSVAAPAITDNGGGVFLAATAAHGGSVMYFASHGRQFRTAGWLAVPPACGPAAPAMTMVSNPAYGAFPEVAATYAC